MLVNVYRLATCLCSFSLYEYLCIPYISFLKGKAQSFLYIYIQMTIALVDKVVTNFRFSE